MKLNTLLLSTLLLGSVALADGQEIKKEAIGYIKMLGGTLKSELQAHIKKDPSGLSAANFCAGSADKITKEINVKLPKHATVRRTSLKTRNSNNSADKIDTEVMNEYIALIESKKFDAKSSIKVVVDGNTTRVYKPLLTQGVCLKCHGSNVSDEISKVVKENYPKDKAMGHTKYDLRGVIVAEITK